MRYGRRARCETSRYICDLPELDHRDSIERIYPVCLTATARSLRARRTWPFRFSQTVRQTVQLAQRSANGILGRGRPLSIATNMAAARLSDHLLELVLLQVAADDYKSRKQ